MTDLPAPAAPVSKGAASAAAKAWQDRRESSWTLAGLLWFVDRLRWPLTALGVDYDSLRTIVRLKLLLDLRGVPIGVRGSESFLKVGFVVVLALVWLFGFGPGLAALLMDSPAQWLAVLSGCTIAMLGLVMFAPSANWMLDTTDIALLSSRPISDRTLFAARLVHFGLYVGLLGLAFGCLPILLALVSFPWWIALVAAPLTVLLSALLTVGLLGSGFALTLRVVGPRRFQSAMLWLQIGLAAMLYGGGQFAQGLIGSARDSDHLRLLLQQTWVRALLPPLHFQRAGSWLLGERTTDNALLAGLGLVTPFLMFGLATALSTRHFLHALTDTGTQAASRPRVIWSAGLLAKLARPWLASREERAGFLYTLAHSRRDRLFLRAAVPALIGPAVMAAAVLFNALQRDAGEALQWLPLSLYLFAMIAPTVLFMSAIGEHWQARWLFQALPLERPQLVLRGGVVALLAGTLLPIMFLVSGILLWMTGSSALPDILLALAVALIAVLSIAGRIALPLPFTQPPQIQDDGTRYLGLFMALSFVIVLVVVAHVALRLWLPEARWVALALVLLLLLPAWRKLERITCLDLEGQPGRRRAAAQRRTT